MLTKGNRAKDGVRIEKKRAGERGGGNKVDVKITR